MKYIICQKCFRIIVKDNDKECLCIYCGNTINVINAEKVFSIGYEPARYGIIYRKKYEEDLIRQGELTSHYCLSETSPLLIWIASAAITGIIGNIATDIIKGIINKIIDVNREEKIVNNDKTFEILASDDDVLKFINDIKEWHEDLNKIDPILRRYIVKERVVERLVKPVMKIQNKMKNEKMSQESIKQELELAISENKKKEEENILAAKDNISFWY